MAKQIRCDKCEMPGANRMVVSVEIYDAVRPGMATGTSLEGDFCETHWEIGAAELTEKVRGRLIRDIPVHRQVQDVYEEMEPRNAALKEAVKVRDAIDEKSTGADKVKRLEAEAKVKSIVEELNALEARRLELIKSAD